MLFFIEQSCYFTKKVIKTPLNLQTYLFKANVQLCAYNTEYQF